MRVLFLTLYPPEAASTRYRVHQYLPHLEAAGIACTVRSAVSAATWQRHMRREAGGSPRPLWYHAEEMRRRLGQLIGAPRYDAVVVQKALLSAYVRGYPALLRLLAKRIVFDLDDAVHLAAPHPLRGMARFFEDRRQVLRLMAQADVTLAGNAWLCDACGEVGGRPVLFPTVVDTERFVPTAQRPGAFRIGWIGNPSTTPHLAEAGIDVGALDGAEVLLMGADPARVPWANAQVLPWSLEAETRFLQSCAVGIMPLPRTTWALGKCALKALQFMACGVPCVATSWGAVRSIIRHGENGFLADTPDEWQRAFEALRDPHVRRQLGEEARKMVAARFSLRRAAGEWVRMLGDLE